MTFFNLRDHDDIDVTKRPTMKLLNRYVINTEHAHAVRWEQIGRILEVSGLEVIRMNSSGSDNVCQERFKATLSKWLRIDAFASWKKLESALNQALRDIEGIGTGKKSDEAPSKVSSSASDESSTTAAVGSLESSTGAKPKVPGPRKGKRKLDDTDGGSAKRPKSNGAHPEGNKKTKSMYTVMSKKDPPCAIIINNEKFDSSTLKERSWSENDVTKILELEDIIGIRFNIHRNLSAQQMENAFTMERSGLSKDNSGLLVFIMTHGTTDDRLYGSDGKPISLKQLVEMFEIDKCLHLKDKPKIFIIHACRGDGVDPVDTQQPEAHTEGPPPAKDVTPQKADFLFVYSTTDGCVAYGQKKKGFISKLVDNLKLKFNDKHLEDVLLDVKKEVAKENYCQDGIDYKQMPSVVSQMRDRVWFAK